MPDNKNKQDEEIDEVKSSSIHEFIGEIGRGFAEAQEALDQRSMQYLCTDPITPSRFAISKMNAEINFAVSTEQKAGLNILFYGSSSQRKEEQNQRVSFDIVSAPLPPEMLPTTPSSKAIPEQSEGIHAVWALNRSMVYDATTRKQVQNIIEEKKLDIDLSEAVIFESKFDSKTSKVNPNKICWLIASVTKGAGGILQLKMTEITVTKTAAGKITVKVSSTKAPKPSAVYQPLLDMLFGFIQLQKKLFSNG